MRIFTVGHSTHAAEAFVALPRTHGVTAVADVRSAPYSASIRSSTGRRSRAQIERMVEILAESIRAVLD